MKNIICAAFLILLFIPMQSSAQGMEDIKIETVKLTEKIYMLIGRGGNIGLSAGEDGVFVIDDQFAPLSEKIIAAIKVISDQPIRFLANTHWHGDHTGGNANMAGEGATIMAHENVRQRLSETPQRNGNSRPKEALPIITFNDKLHLHINGERADIIHVEHAHTDGDALIFFTQSNVLHTGDTYFKGRYPYIDLNSGGSVDGYISAAEKTIKIIDDNTKIIPGHGTLSNKEEFEEFLSMLKWLRTIIQDEINKGLTEEEVVGNSSLTKLYDEKGFGDGFINGETARRIFYRSLKN